MTYLSTQRWQAIAERPPHRPNAYVTIWEHMVESQKHDKYEQKLGAKLLTLPKKSIESGSPCSYLHIVRHRGVDGLKLDST